MTEQEGLDGTLQGQSLSEKKPKGCERVDVVDVSKWCKVDLLFAEGRGRHPQGHGQKRACRRAPFPCWSTNQAEFN